VRQDVCVQADLWVQSLKGALASLKLLFTLDFRRDTARLRCRLGGGTKVGQGVFGLGLSALSLEAGNLRAETVDQGGQTADLEPEGVLGLRGSILCLHPLWGGAEHGPNNDRSDRVVEADRVVHVGLLHLDDSQKPYAYRGAERDRRCSAIVGLSTDRRSPGRMPSGQAEGGTMTDSPVAMPGEDRAMPVR
jgi:hypothetical protein